MVIFHDTYYGPIAIYHRDAHSLCILKGAHLIEERTFGHWKTLLHIHLVYSSFRAFSVFWWIVDFTGVLSMSACRHNCQLISTINQLFYIEHTTCKTSGLCHTTRHISTLPMKFIEFNKNLFCGITTPIKLPASYCTILLSIDNYREFALIVVPCNFAIDNAGYIQVSAITALNTFE